MLRRTRPRGGFLLSKECMNEYYVYVVWLGNEVVYIGSGKGDRYKHVSNGRSHNESLNLLFRQGVEVRQEFEYTGLTELTARVYEQELIDKYEPPYNKAKAANEDKKALHKELTTELLQIRADSNPTETYLWIGRAYFNLWKATSNYHLLQASFAMSKATPSGDITFTAKELSEFVAKYVPLYKDKMFFVQCQALAGAELLYKTNGREIVNAVAADTKGVVRCLRQQKESFDKYLECTRKACVCYNQLVLF
jgi:hypothetical protein